MTIRRILHATLSFLAVNIGICPYVVAASTLQVTQTSQEISGTDSKSGVAFRASLLAADHAVVDLYIGTKRIHAEIDYGRHTTRLRSISKATETPVALSVQDILAFQELRGSLPPKITTSARHADALGSLINLMADAPAGHVIDFNSGLFGGSYTSICPQIGKPGLATFRLGRFSEEFYHIKVIVGPVCYKDPALGRCGIGGVPDTGPIGIGFVQRFTQKCLNHDVCCDKTKESSAVCGFGCAPAFDAAIWGYIFAPDCGTTAGTWTDNDGFPWSLMAGDGSGEVQTFSGTVDTGSGYFGCGIWDVVGTRTGTGPKIDFTATDRGSRCAASTTFTGAYDCNKANGSVTNSDGGSGSWSWRRTNTVRAPTVNVGPNTPAWTRGPNNVGIRPTNK